MAKAVDSDELQHMDELNSDWVQEWHNATSRRRTARPLQKRANSREATIELTTDPVCAGLVAQTR